MRARAQDIGGIPVAAVVLAAGRSSRMGQHKLLLPLGGTAIVAHTVAAACASEADPVLVVVGHEAERVRVALPPGRHTVVANPDHAQGMASSLRAGIAALPQEVAGALVVLGDQPLITAELLDRLIAAAHEHPHGIVAASYEGRRGHPVYFPRRYFSEVQAVRGDEGGRSVLTRHREALVVVECGDLAPDLDADTPEDYRRLQEEWARRARERERTE